ncbi:MAG: tight adherence protein C [Lysobacterales bacterium]|jgi:tight adherence protein C
MGMVFPGKELRPTLGSMGERESDEKAKKHVLRIFIGNFAKINRPICKGALRDRILKDLAVGHVNLNPDEFFLIKEIGIVAVALILYPSINADMIFFWIVMSIAVGYMLPEFWLKGKIKRVKNEMIKELPDAIDLLALCVNAGLDFMLALKWVVQKSSPSVVVDEFNIMLQEINVGKTRRDAIKDLARRYDLPDLSTFARTLIQADKMGTSVTDALNILSEDMRISRYRRGEQIALKAPMKMLIPLLLFIFPVVGILVAGPIFLDFMENNPFNGMK